MAKCSHPVAATAAVGLVLASTLVGLTAGPVAASERASSEKPLSAKAFRKAANRICEANNATIGQLREQHLGEVARDTPPDLETLTAYIEDLEPVIEQQIADIDALKPPKKLQKKVNRLLKTAQRSLDGVVADPSIALESDPFAEANDLSVALGLHACAGGAAREGSG